MDARRWIGSWPAYRQVAERDWLGLGAAVKSERSERLAPRVRNADNVVKSVCPYCAVGCMTSDQVPAACKTADSFFPGFGTAWDGVLAWP